MSASLPSPPPHHTLPYASLPLDQVEALRSSCGQLLVAIEEIQGMINWGGEAGIIGWPSLLSAYQRVMSLLSLLNHHMTATSAPPQASSFGVAKPSLTLSQHVVHPHIPSDPAAEAWIQALLSTHSAVTHEPPPEATVGDAPAHEARRQRALRVCTALSGMHDWKGRVGLVADAEPEAGEGSDAMDEDEDIFGSGDEDDFKPSPTKADPAQAGQPGTLPETPTLDKDEKAQELKRLLGMMARGQPPS